VKAAHGAADPPAGTAIDISREPFDSPEAEALVDALMADLDERYAEDPADLDERHAEDPADGDDPDVAAHFTVRAEQVTPPAGVFLVARLDGVPVGCGAVRLVPGGAADVAEIKRMYTTPAARRRGVSRALLARLESEAAALGYRRLQLETGLRQPEAIALYGSVGYHRIPSYGQYEGHELSVCFAKDLSPAGTDGR
jgi:GNAT superfamily N-acetyltransferase